MSEKRWGTIYVDKFKPEATAALKPDFYHYSVGSVCKVSNVLLSSMSRGPKALLHPADSVISADFAVSSTALHFCMPTT